MSTLSLNIIISGASVSGNIDGSRTKVMIDLGNSDRIGKATFALQNKDSTYSSYLFSGNATVQVDAMLGNTLVKTLFRGWLEEGTPWVDVKQGSVVDFVGYDYGQELLGLISPDSRQKSLLNTDGTLSLTSGDQGMGSRNGMDLVLFVSGVVSKGAVGGGVGYNSGQPAATLSMFMSQYFGQSGDTTGTWSGLSFSFKSYFSGMTIWGTNPFYKTWYVQDGASDTNSNYTINYDTLRARHEYAWDVIRKLTRHGMVYDRSGIKVQFETYIDTSGGIHLRTSGSSDFLAGQTLVYYAPGNSGNANNNILDVKVPWKTADLKDYIVGWFPVWTTYPFGDDWTDIVAYSGTFWSGTSQSGTVVLSGNAPGPGAPGLISIDGAISGLVLGVGAVTNLDLVFTLWSGYTINMLRWNVSGGGGVSLNYLAYAPSTNGGGAYGQFFKNVAIYDAKGNAIIKSGSASANNVPQGMTSGWVSISDNIYSASGTFFSGTGQDGGWAVSGTSWSGGAVKKIVLGIGATGGSIAGLLSGTLGYIVDNLGFAFAYDFNPVVAFNSGAQFSYGRRYEVVEFPYQTTDSGAANVIQSELYGKMQSRQLAEFTVQDKNNSYKANLNIVPGQAFVLDAPSLSAGSGQFYYYFVATEVKHEWSHQQGFFTRIKAWPFFSGATVLSGQNMISYSLPMPAPIPRATQQMPITHWWGPNNVNPR